MLREPNLTLNKSIHVSFKWINTRLYIIPPLSDVQNKYAKHKVVNRQTLQGILTNIECQTTDPVITVVQYMLMPKPNAKHTVSPVKHVANETILPEFINKHNTNLNLIY